MSGCDLSILLLNYTTPKYNKKCVFGLITQTESTLLPWFSKPTITYLWQKWNEIVSYLYSLSLPPFQAGGQIFLHPIIMGVSKELAWKDNSFSCFWKSFSPLKKLHFLSWRERTFESKERVEIWAWIGKRKEGGVSENLKIRAMVMDDPRRWQTSVATHTQSQSLSSN